VTTDVSQLSFFDLPPSPDRAYVLRVVKVPIIEPRPEHLRPEGWVEGHEALTIEGQFARFHMENPHVYELLVRLARDLVSRGHRKVGIGMLFEVARWRTMLTTIDEVSPFKLNNNYRSRYARLIMENEPDLGDVFDVRELRS
jgi:hypothetical protein